MAVLKFVVDKCIGCGICQLACSAVKEGVFNPKLACLQIHSYYEEDRLIVEGELCDLCLKCVDACPTEAITVENGLLHLDEENCNQCGVCVDACPYGVIHISSSDRVLLCDLCGGSPQCVRWCPHEAIYKEEVVA